VGKPLCTLVTPALLGNTLSKKATYFAIKVKGEVQPITGDEDLEGE